MFDNKIYGDANNNNLVGDPTASNAIYGYDGNDTVTGGSNADLLDAGSGSDVLYGERGNDLLYGGLGNDALYDRLSSATLLTGNDAMYGGDGNDSLYSSNGDDSLFGGNGDDFLAINYSSNSWDAVVLYGDAGNDFIDASYVDGTYSLYGGNGDDFLYATGSLGNHVLDGGLGADTMRGGTENDTFYVDDINDQVVDDGGSSDTVYVNVDNFVTPFAESIENIVYGQGVKQVAYFIQDIFSGYSWSKIGQAASVSYSFALAADGGEQGFQLYTDAQKSAVRLALAKYSAVAGLTFVETSDGSNVDIRLFRDDLTSANASNAEAYGLFPSWGGDLHMNVAREDMSYGSYNFQTLLHEIGHTVGLKHPHDAPVLPTAENTQTNTVMTYNDDSTPATELGIFDLASLHYAYGVNQTVRAGSQTYGFGSRYVWDGAGVDTFSASTATTGVFIDLTPGSWQYIGSKASSIFASGQAFIGFGTIIENAMSGSGNDSVFGNDQNNKLSSGLGNDLLKGGSGNDTLIGGIGLDSAYGGLGDDFYYVDNAGDAIFENINEGFDRVYASVSYHLTSNLENLYLQGTAMLTATGNELANYIAANSANSILHGGLGNDSLAGGVGNDSLYGDFGVDRTSGGLGDDAYFVDGSGDVVVENTDEGTDRIYSSVTYTTPINVERIYLVGTSIAGATGNTLSNIIGGNSANNVLNGLGGNDLIGGGEGNDTLNGGSGLDTLNGGLGDDIYLVDLTSDVITEIYNEGLDTVMSSVSYSLSSNIEKLTLTGTFSINATGNGINNTLIGNSGGNTLSSNGGNDILIGAAGNDVLKGGLGSDTYQFARGHGNDSLIDSDNTVGNTDVMSFLVGVNNDQLWFRHVGGDLVVNIIGTNDQVTVVNWYQSNSNHVEQISANGKTLLDSNVDSLVAAMSAFTPPAFGQTTLPTSYQTALNSTIAANWS